MAINICTFLWGDKYNADYVEKLRAGVDRHLKQEHSFHCMTERDRIANFSSGIVRHAIKDPDLIGRGCFPRLRLFDPEWQKRRGFDDRIVCLDLDTVIVGELDPLFDRAEQFVILQGANSANPCPYNCSAFMLRPGAHPEAWRDFSIEAAGRTQHYEFPDDQGWIWSKVPNAAGWQVGAASGIYAFGKPGWPADGKLPADARIVAFPGWRDPAKFTDLDWVQANWRM